MCFRCVPGGLSSFFFLFNFQIIFPLKPYPPLYPPSSIVATCWLVSVQIFRRRNPKYLCSDRICVLLHTMMVSSQFQWSKIVDPSRPAPLATLIKVYANYYDFYCELWNRVSLTDYSRRNDMYSRDEVRALQDKMSRIFLVSIFPLFIFLLFNLTRCFNLPSDHEFFFPFWNLQ